MSFTQFIATLKARKVLFAAVFASTILLALVISLILPKKYTGAAAVVIDVKSPDPIAGMILPGMNAPGYMTTQIEVIKSDRVARAVVKALRLNELPQVRADWMDATNGDGDMIAWLVDGLSRNLDVIPSKESNVINISYTAAEPRFAAAMANAYVQAYIDTTVELRAEPARQYATLFEGQAKSLRDRMEQAQTKLSEYQKANGLLDTNERLDVENARLNELSTQLVGLQALSAESMSRKASATANSPEVLNNPVISALKAELARQEARVKELSSRYGTAHPQVMEAQANVNEVRAKLEVETSKITSSLGINNTVNLTREAQVRIALEQQRQKLLKLKEQRDQAAVLVKDVENSQRAYDAIQARISQTNLETQITQTNVSRLKFATPPALPSFPKTLLNVIVSVFLGFGFACGACVFRETFDRRLRDTTDVIQKMGLPLLAVIPVADTNSMPSQASTKRLAAPKRALPELPKPAR